MSYGFKSWKTRRTKMPEKFWQRVHILGADECWNFDGDQSRIKYHKMAVDGIPKLTHRLSWETSFGPIPEGLCVCHKCDNPPCCNPRHLFIGTMGDNTRDCLEKGRRQARKGEDTNLSKLTEVEVKKIRIARISGKRQSQLAKEFRVNQSTISLLVRRKTWKHI